MLDIKKTAIERKFIEERMQGVNSYIDMFNIARVADIRHAFVVDAVGYIAVMFSDGDMFYFQRFDDETYEFTTGTQSHKGVTRAEIESIFIKLMKDMRDE